MMRFPPLARFPIPHPLLNLVKGWEWETTRTGDARDVRVIALQITDCQNDSKTFYLVKTPTFYEVKDKNRYFNPISNPCRKSNNGSSTKCARRLTW